VSVYVRGERESARPKQGNHGGGGGGEEYQVLRNAVNAGRAGGKSSAETYFFFVILLYFIFYLFILVFNFIGGVRAVSRPISVVCLRAWGGVPPHPPPGTALGLNRKRR
jgi:hypothetical protein